MFVSAAAHDAGPAGSVAGVSWLRVFRRRWVRVTASATLAVAVALVAWAFTRPAPGTTGGLVGERAPAWSGRLSNGTGTVNSADERGHWVVLNFFATWCPPCVAETPQLVQFAAQHRSDRGVRLIGVIHADSVSAVDAYARSHEVSWPLLEDPAGNIAAAFGLPGLPQSVVIAPDGRLVTRLTGGVTASELDRVIAGGDAPSG